MTKTQVYQGIYEAVQAEKGLGAGRLLRRKWGGLVTEVCTLGAYLYPRSEGRLPRLGRENVLYLTLGVTGQCEIVTTNDDFFGTPKQRRAHMLNWLANKIAVSQEHETVLGPVIDSAFLAQAQNVLDQINALGGTK